MSAKDSGYGGSATKDKPEKPAKETKEPREHNKSEKGDKSKERPLKSNDGGRMDRATGNKNSEKPSERACKAPAKESALKSEAERRETKEKLEGELAELARAEKKAAIARSDAAQAASAERCGGYEDCNKDAQKKENEILDNATKSLEYTRAGVTMGVNYVEMRHEWTQGNDSYFHCKANCEATALGPDGERAARDISDWREASDGARDAKKGKSVGDSRADSRSDQRANYYGREIGRSRDSTRCAPACYDRFYYRREK